MKGSNQYRYAEHCLYSYLSNRETYQRLKRELALLRAECDVHGQNYDRSIQGGSSSPVERYVERIERLEIKLNRLHHKLRPIQKLRRELSSLRSSNLKRLILERYYFEHCKPETFQTQHRVSRQKYYASRRQLVIRVMSLMEIKRKESRFVLFCRPQCNETPQED